MNMEEFSQTVLRADVARMVKQTLERNNLRILCGIPGPPRLTRWQRFCYAVRCCRERLGEIIAGRTFDNGDW